MEKISLQELPASLKEIPEPPNELWLEGTLPPPGTKYLAVVGSRALSSYGREACELLIAGLARYPVSIVSGLALGADACAHNAALAAGLHTIAIPGSGLGKEVLYPRANVRLAQRILEAGGALLSEHPPDYQARPYDFPSRNRLMVGIVDAVLMIEAGSKSGTLITARLAADYNRDLLCVPHRIGDKHSFGTHLFLRLGATLATESSHILEALCLEARKPEQQTLFELSKDEQLIYTLLAEPRTRDELLRACALPSHTVLSVLGMLELKGAATEKMGMWMRL